MAKTDKYNVAGIQMNEQAIAAAKRIRRKQATSSALRYVVLVLVGLVMVYPLIWMIGASFKNNNEIFVSLSPFAKNPTVDGYVSAMKKVGGDITIWRAMLNTYSYVLPKVLFTVISAVITAYGFARFEFVGKKILFPVMMGTLFLPQVVLNVPQFVMFTQFGWVGSDWYLALIVPSIFATDTYFVFMLIQFLRNVPHELEEAANIDGCNVVQTLVKIIVPMIMPSVVSCALFQFMWSSNDFLGPLLYVIKPAKYPVAIFLRMSMDADKGFSWNRILAVSLISMIPSLIVFFSAQNQFVEGISAGGVKG